MPRFKLLLQPNDPSAPSSSNAPPHAAATPRLPAGKTITDVYTDFYGHLFRLARQHIVQTNPTANGSIWDAVKDNVDIVLSHPNGWRGEQQSVMRDAAVRIRLYVEDERTVDVLLTHVQDRVADDWLDFADLVGNLYGGALRDAIPTAQFVRERLMRGCKEGRKVDGSDQDGGVVAALAGGSSY